MRSRTLLALGATVLGTAIPAAPEALRGVSSAEIARAVEAEYASVGAPGSPAPAVEPRLRVPLAREIQVELDRAEQRSSLVPDLQRPGSVALVGRFRPGGSGLDFDGLTIAGANLRSGHLRDFIGQVLTADGEPTSVPGGVPGSRAGTLR